MKIFTGVRMLAILAMGLISTSAFAQNPDLRIYDGTNGNPIGWNDLLKNVRAGQVVVISDTHGYEPQHLNQRDYLVHISGSNLPISTGMEFFSYPDQPIVDKFMREEMTEEDFLKAVKWGSIPFDNYRFQVVFPKYFGGTTVGLNLPRTITGKVAKNGLASLTEDEKKLLPPDYSRGASTYFERFRETMKEHATPDQIENYFWAHSLWDDTMAWQAAEYMRLHPDHHLVVIVGDFHVAYRDGIIARMKARGLKDIISISHVMTDGLSADEQKAQREPHPVYGPRSDFIFETK